MIFILHKIEIMNLINHSTLFIFFEVGRARNLMIIRKSLFINIFLLTDILIEILMGESNPEKGGHINPNK